MSGPNFLDQDFGAESDDDVNFNPAPADESDNEGEVELSEKHRGGREGGRRSDTRSRSPEDTQHDVDDSLTQSGGAKADERRQRKGKTASSGIRKTVEMTENGSGEADSDAEKLEDEKEPDDEGDEDDEDDDEDDEEVAGHRRKRRKDRGVQGLFDVEAEVDEDEDELEDEDDELKEGDGFIADTHPDDLADLPAGGDTDDRRHRELDRRREVEASLDAERQAEEYRKRYGRNRAAPTDSVVTPKRLLLPDVDDPSIWGVRCKPGKEREIIFAITKRVEERAKSRSPLVITSAFERGGTMAGYVYVEARKQSDVFTALEGLSNVYPRTKMVLVPIKEMPDLLRTMKSKEIEPGSYVRIKRGKYQGDVAQVDSVVQSGLEVGLRIVPRLDYGLNEDVNAPMAENGAQGPAGKRKRVGLTKAKVQASRPPQRLFSEVDARKKHAKYLHPGGKNAWLYLNDTYKNGFLLKDFKVNYLQTENVNPTLEEVTRFASGDEDGTENLDLNALAANLKSSALNAAYIPGDIVEVYDGEQQGVGGNVLSVQGDIVTLNVTQGELKGQTIEVPTKGLRKRFREGDHVQVVGGSRFRDEVGMVVKVNEDRVTILSDVNMNEITVFNKDIRKARGTGIKNALGKYGLYNLVQLDPATVGAIIAVDRESLQVLDQNGSIRTVMPSQISNRLDQRRNAVATDKNGSQIQIEDTVREIGGEGKQGMIIHIHRSFLFILSNVKTSEAGMFVARANNVATIAAKGGRLTGNPSAGPDLSKMNPALQRGGMNGSMPPPAVPRVGRDRALGKTVMVRKGPYKGLLGIVKDTTDFVATVELHTGGKTVTVAKDSLGIKDPITGQTTSLSGFQGGRGRGNGMMGRGNYGGATPIRRPDEWQGSRTPMAANVQQGRTPLWSSGARTPMATGSAMASSRTPAWKQDHAFGGQTPAYLPEGSRTVNPYNSGGQTSYGGGSQTPAWYSGERTPFGQSGLGDSFNTGSKTPAYHPGEAWNAGSASSGPDGWNGSKTPSYGGSTSFGGSTGNENRPYDMPAGGGPAAAPTPAGFAAPTPAASAPTPRGPPAWNSTVTGNPTWGGESAPTPAAISAPTPGASSNGGGAGGGDKAGLSRPGYYDGAPTPAGYGNAETPGNWGGAEDDDQPRYSTPSP